MSHKDEYIRMGKAKDITGNVYGKLKALGPIGKTKVGGYVWECSCECGKTCHVRSTDLISGRTKSCGCAISYTRYREHPLHSTWRTMLRRCVEENNISFKNYGARGIAVCDRWKDFNNFISDMGDKPKGFTLDRIDNDGDYTPENCKWTSWKKQNRKRRNSRLVTHEGETRCVSEWAEIIGEDYQVVYRRVIKGMGISGGE